MSKLFEISVVRIGTPGATPCDRSTVLGNPFVMRHESERDSVCDEYERYFSNKIASQDPVYLNELRKLYKLGKQQGYLKLGCHCAPKRCHADTIANFLQRYT